MGGRGERVACSAGGGGGGGGLNAEKVSTEISFATGVQSARLVIPVFVLMEWDSSVIPQRPRFSLNSSAAIK